MKKVEALQSELAKMSLLIESRLMDGNISTKAGTSLVKQLAIIVKLVAKQKARSNKTNHSSGLQKLQSITPEMADFANWDVHVLRSRVNVTKFLCEYIKEHDLQNPNNRREIFLNNDLKRVLQIDFDVITYPYLQKYIYILFRNNDTLYKPPK